MKYTLLRCLLLLSALSLVAVTSCAQSPTIASTANTPATITATKTTAVTMPPPPLLLQGDIKQGALVIGRTAPGSTVQLGTRPLRLSADGIFVFGLDRDAPREITLTVTDAQGIPTPVVLTVKPREYRIQRVEGISEKIMNPTPQDLLRIEADNAQTALARKRNDDRLDFMSSFIWPADGPITGVFGSQRYYNGVPKRPHYGVDVGVPVGTPVRAPAAGIVTLAHPDMFYSGGTLIIDHGHGVSSTLMHLSAILVKTGDLVSQGQEVAKSGASGRASGPHLDWRMNWFGERIDAQLLVPPRQ